ncbi:sporulation integral membrane protein YtvI [Paraliobacillus sp. JSM ZJ581]|uniref:sporulation integral membrane protein YtvI n=1 Tax=Paraliobacillus sp. JSM ZJ581 TaxID=3342118 RepID=UPI0035A9464B
MIDTIFGAINMHSHPTVLRLLRLLHVVIIFLITITVVYFTIIYIYPFVIAFLLAILLIKPIHFIEKTLPVSRGVACFFIIVGIFILITLFIACSTMESIQAFKYLSKHIPVHINTLAQFVQLQLENHIIPFYNRLMNQFDALEQSQQQAITQQLQQSMQQLTETSASFIETMFTSFIKALQAIPAFFSICMFILLGTFFICKEWYKLKEWYQLYLPSFLKNIIPSIGLATKHAFLGYFKAQLLLTFISTSIIYLGFVIIRVDFAFTLALLIGLVDFIPYVGTGLFFIPWIGYLFLTGDYSLTIPLAILYGVVIIQRQITEPKLMATHIGVNPLLILMITFISYRFFGMIGILIAPLLTISLQILHQSGLTTCVWKYIKDGSL